MTAGQVEGLSLGASTTTTLAAVIVVSDEVATGLDDDRAGPVALDLLQNLGLRTTLAVVGDADADIETAVRTAIVQGARVVLACGGTGIGPRDRTSDVVRALIDVELPGIAEEIRRRGSEHTRLALVSREVAGLITAGVRRPVLVLAVPGSRGGVRDALGVVGDLIGYILDQADGAGHA